MGRVSARHARLAKEKWAAELSGTVNREVTKPQREEPGHSGVDYAEADSRWVCNRKKAYGGKWIADKVAARLNEANSTDDARPGFRGVHVVAYLCRRCGEYHIGR